MSKKIRVLLTEAINQSKLEETFAPSLGLGYLASYLRTNLDDVTVRLVDSSFSEVLNEFKPDLIGISSVSQNYNRAKYIAQLAHQFGGLVVVGGPHISALPKTLSPDMDLGVMGEGEATLAEIVKTLQKHGRSPDLTRWAEIPGLVFRDLQGDLHRTSPRPSIRPLDRIPFPARDLLAPNSNYYHLISSRGCPYNCIFCSSTRFWGGVRYHSADYVVREIELLLDKYSPQTLTFFDDLFIASRKRLRCIVALIREKEIHKRVSFELTVRANLINEEIVALLQQMNVINVLIGLESGSERVLKFLKGNITLEQNQRAVDLLHGGGINISGTFIIGAPDETRQEVLQTLDFIKRNPLSEARTYILTPLPGTPIWDLAKARHLVSDNMDWSKLDLTSSSIDKITVSEVLSPEALDELYKLFDRVRMRRHLRRFLFSDVPSRLIAMFRHPIESIRKLLLKSHNLWRQMRYARKQGVGIGELLFSKVKAIISGMR